MPGASPTPAALLAGVLTSEYLDDQRPNAESLRGAFRPIHDTDALAALTANPAADLGLSTIAADINAGRQPFFDHHLEQDLLPDWLATPGGGSWPLLPAKVYDHADFLAHGDIRLLWELGRLQAAPALAAHARLQSDAESARQALLLLAHFRDANPVGWGPHWIAGLESALRIFSLLWTWQLLPAEHLDDETALLLTASLLENGRFLAEHLSEKEIANNHLVGEAAALYALGSALPVFPDSAAWRERGLRILHRELPLQVLRDGVLAEQAVEYHRFVLEFYLQAHLWGRAAGDDASDTWLETMRSMFRPLAALYGPDLQLVSLGDDDAGRIIRLDNRSRRDVGGLLALGFHLLGVQNLGKPAQTLNGEALWLAGPVPMPECCPGDLPALENFHMAGWHSARFGERCDTGIPSGHLVFKSGPMGRGGGGHSHLDQLALTVSYGGHPVLVDAGTCLYNGSQDIRDHFRGGLAHNILRVNKQDSAEPHAAPDRFGWNRKGSAELRDSGCAGSGYFWEAVRHGDRGPGNEPLTVTRRVTMLREGIVVIMDSVQTSDTGPELLHLSQQWLCAPGCEPNWDKTGTTTTGMKGMTCRRLTVSSVADPVLIGHFYGPEALETRDKPGWFSDDYDRKEPVWQLALAGQTAPPWLFVTVLADPRSSFSLTESRLSGDVGKIVLEMFGEADENRVIDLPWIQAEAMPHD
ncbi:MAG: hypothetical protein GY835_04430 [bacterium]|nr:hypothetical protein [bacterium]